MCPVEIRVNHNCTALIIEMFIIKLERERERERERETNEFYQKSVSSLNHKTL